MIKRLSNVLVVVVNRTFQYDHFYLIYLGIIHLYIYYICVFSWFYVIVNVKVVNRFSVLKMLISPNKDKSKTHDSIFNPRDYFDEAYYYCKEIRSNEFYNSN